MIPIESENAASSTNVHYLVTIVVLKVNAKAIVILDMLTSAALGLLYVCIGTNLEHTSIFKKCIYV